MMNNNFSWFSFKKIIFLVVIIFVITVLIYAASVFRYIHHSKVEDEDNVIEFVKASSKIEEVTGLDYFADTKVYDIIYGKDGSNQKYLAYNPKGNTDESKLIVVPLVDLLSKNKIEKNWQSSCDGCTLKKSGPAILEDKPLWELTYSDQKDRYVMEYISLEDGSTYEKLRMNKKYK